MKKDYREIGDDTDRTKAFLCKYENVIHVSFAHHDDSLQEVSLSSVSLRKWIGR